MKHAFVLDGVSYNVFVPEGGIRRSGQILDGENAGRTPSGAMIRDIVGTYYNYTIDMDTSGMDVEEYDKLYEVITAPMDCHTLEVPYAQGTLAFTAYVTGAEDTLKTMADGRNLWGGMSINFIAMKPQRKQ